VIGLGVRFHDTRTHSNNRARKAFRLNMKKRLEASKQTGDVNGRTIQAMKPVCRFKLNGPRDYEKLCG